MRAATPCALALVLGLGAASAAGPPDRPVYELRGADLSAAAPGRAVHLREIDAPEHFAGERGCGPKLRNGRLVAECAASDVERSHRQAKAGLTAETPGRARATTRSWRSPRCTVHGVDLSVDPASAPHVRLHRVSGSCP